MLISSTKKKSLFVVHVFDKEKAEARAHILEGLLIALDHIDEVIRIIRASETDAEAQAELMSKF